MANKRSKAAVASHSSKPRPGGSSDASVRRYRAPALEKGLDVLEVLAARRQPMTMVQISAELDRSMGELFRMIQVLEFRGYVQASDSGNGYVLTDRLFALGMTRAPVHDLVDAATPHMRAFAGKANQSCHLVVASGDQMVVIKRAEAAGDFGFTVRVGFRRPIVGSTSGLVIFAFQSEDVRQEWKTRLRPGVSERAWEEFEAKARKVRRDGFARIPSDLTKGITDVSAPITHMGLVVGALTCPHVGTLDSLSIDEALTCIRATAQEITKSLAGGLK